jgi:hypothetical protein
MYFLRNDMKKLSLQHVNCDPMCSLVLGVRCGFPLKRNMISLFVQAKKKKNHTLTTLKSPTSNPISKTRARPSIGIALI